MQHNPQYRPPCGLRATGVALAPTLHLGPLPLLRSCAPSPRSHPTQACLFGCGISTGLGAVWNNCKVEYGSSVAVFGLGAVGFAVVQACKAVGCTHIVGVDVNPKKFELAKKLGCPACDTPPPLASSLPWLPRAS